MCKKGDNKKTTKLNTHKMWTFSNCEIKVVLSPSKEISFTCVNENPLKMMKNAFYFCSQDI